jgi:hypothetical protein
LTSYSTGSKPALPRKRSKLDGKLAAASEEAGLAGVDGALVGRHGNAVQLECGVAGAGEGEEETAAEDGIVTLEGVAIERVPPARPGVDHVEAFGIVAAPRRRGKEPPAVADGFGVDHRQHVGLAHNGDRARENVRRERGFGGDRHGRATYEAADTVVGERGVGSQGDGA